MEAVKKMILVDPEILKSKNPHDTDAVSSILTGFQDQLKKILDSNLSPSQKVFRFNQVLVKYRRYRDKYSPVTTTNEAEELSEPMQTLEEEEDTGIISKVPKTYKPKAKILLGHLEDNDIKWNSTRELISEDGQVVKGSDIAQLISYVTGRKKAKPAGLKEFSNQLKKTNVPDSIFGSADKRTDILKGTIQVGTGRRKKKGRKNLKTKKKRVRKTRVKKRRVSKNSLGKRKLIWHRLKKN